MMEAGSTNEADLNEAINLEIISANCKDDDGAMYSDSPLR